MRTFMLMLSFEWMLKYVLFQVLDSAMEAAQVQDSPMEPTEELAVRYINKHA
jgi:hypothetical protein